MELLTSIHLNHYVRGSATILYYMIPFNKDVTANKVEYLSKFLEYTLKIKRLNAKHNIIVTKKYIKPTYITKEGDYNKQFIKVPLPTIPVDKAFSRITNEIILQAINAEGIYANDFVFTQDFACVINKERSTLYLLDEKDYVIEAYNTETLIIVVMFPMSSEILDIVKSTF